MHLKVLSLLIGVLGQHDAGTHSRTGCDGNSLEIRCAGGTEIKIVQAIYGRFQSDTCKNIKEDYQEEMNCSISVDKTLEVIGESCDGKTNCAISVSANAFERRGIDDPCPSTSKYLNVKYECKTVDYECPGVAFGSTSPIEHFTTYRQEGAWATDPLDNEGRVYFLPWNQSGATEMKEFRNLEDLLHSNQHTYYRLDTRADGTGFVVRDRKLYYNKRQSREVRRLCKLKILDSSERHHHKYNKKRNKS